ncbi:MAG: NIPSNAP family protein [Fuerstiella sp.]
MTDRIHCRLAALATLITGMFVLPAISSADVYELRTYTTNDGKLDDLNARFRDHTVALFKKHGMTSVGYWVPVDEPKSTNTLIYVLKHSSREAAARSWQDFLADPEWKQVAKESQKDGPILAKAPESTYMDATDYSPTPESDRQGKKAVFELRIYRTNPGQLQNLDARFRDHTIRIFRRHGIESVAYWHPADEPASSDTLIYIVRHNSRDAARASWKAFSADDEWKRVARESQKDGKFLRERPESVYMRATDYSALQ